MSSATKDVFFNPAKPTAQQKMAMTDYSARRILEAEVAARQKKTEKLRQLRLEKEALAPVEAPAEPKKRARKK